MPFIPSNEAPRFSLHNACFTGLASPARGATDTAVWMVELHPGAPATPHQLTREEVFVCLEGRAVATVGDLVYDVTPGSALIVPPYTQFSIANPDALPFRAVAILPVGGQARIGDQPAFTPPWAA